MELEFVNHQLCIEQQDSDKHIYEELSHAKELPMQGRLLDNIDADYLLLQNIFRNLYINFIIQ